MNTVSNCNTSTLDAYIPSAAKPWNIARAKHLYRRLCFGATNETLENALLENPLDIIDNLIEEAINRPLTPDPGWGYLDRDGMLETYGDILRSETRDELTRIFVEDARSGSLRPRLVAFWTNHFVTEHGVFEAPAYLYQQHIMRQTHALGNFRDFVRAVGLDKAMLTYLNGDENIAAEPNENYARELFELFTLGVDNGYTEYDIQETSRALTGYTTITSAWGEILFNEATFDSGEKTIFGETGNWGYDDVINLLFDLKAPLIANFICGELYKYFVSPVINETIVGQLAQTFLDNDFELAPMLSQLFRSEHFFDDTCIGTIIKSPLDLIVTLQKELEMDYSASEEYEINERTRIFFSHLDYSIFDPPNVAGWPGDTDWLNAISLTERWLRTNHQLTNQNSADPDVYASFPLKFFSPDESDPDLVAIALVNHFLCKDLIHPEEYDDAIVAFKSGVPENYFTDGIWNLENYQVPTQVFNLFKHIIQIPEFQLK